MPHQNQNPYTTPGATFTYEWLEAQGLKTGPYLFDHNENDPIAAGHNHYNYEYHAVLHNGAIAKTISTRPLPASAHEPAPNWRAMRWTFL